jgi:crotonobetainyl-CoA hydratase
MTTTDPVDERAAAAGDAITLPQDEAAVLTDLIGHVLLITINRPHARNAVNSAVARGLGVALEWAESNEQVRAVVLTGAGSAFCSGADLKALARGERVDAGPGAREQAWGFAGFVRHPISKPIIAAVNGVALGGGTELVLASDLAVAATSSSFGLPEVTRGLIAGGGGAFRLPRTVAQKVAMELLLTGDVIDAAAAQQLGLINHVVPTAAVVTQAMALGERIAANAPLAVQASKRVAYAVVDEVVAAETELWRLSDEADARMRASRDAAEGAAAFVARRVAVWIGR